MNDAPVGTRPALWRIGNRQTLSGEGGLRYAARWHSAGRPIVYLAESPAGALIEMLVHLELDASELPVGYMLLRVAVPPEIAIESIKVPAGEDWRRDLAVTRQLGDGWLARGESVLARVPSVLLPETFNVLLNPLHAAAQRVSVAGSTPVMLDQRLMRSARV